MGLGLTAFVFWPNVEQLWKRVHNVPTEFQIFFPKINSPQKKTDAFILNLSEGFSYGYAELGKIPMFIITSCFSSRQVTKL